MAGSLVVFLKLCLGCVQHLFGGVGVVLGVECAVVGGVGDLGGLDGIRGVVGVLVWGPDGGSSHVLVLLARGD